MRVLKFSKKNPLEGAEKIEMFAKVILIILKAICLDILVYIKEQATQCVTWNNLDYTTAGYFSNAS